MADTARVANFIHRLKLQLSLDVEKKTVGNSSLVTGLASLLELVE